MVESLSETTKDYEVLAYLNDDDDYQKYPFGEVGPDQPTSKSWNELAGKCRGDLLMVGSDDILFRTKGWNNFEIPEDGIAAYSFRDGRGSGHPHPVVTRKWFETLGYLHYPKFHHWYVDTWICSIAVEIGRLFYYPEILVEHCHVKNGKADNDETYQRIRRDGTHARDVRTWEENKHLIKEEAQKLASLCNRDCRLPREPHRAAV